MLIPSHLVDEKVCGFIEWKNGLHQEDIQQFESIVKRPTSAYMHLYKIYLEFQESEGAVAARRFYYGAKQQGGKE
jgi:hypothetical protein